MLVRSAVFFVILMLKVQCRCCDLCTEFVSSELVFVWMQFKFVPTWEFILFPVGAAAS